MTGESAVSTSTLQQGLQQISRCLGVTKRGQPCLAPVQTGKSWCQAHDPKRQDVISEERSQAARQSHARRVPVELIAWADAIDWTQEAKVRESLREMFVLLAKGGLTPAQGQAMARVAELRLRAFTLSPPVDRKPLVVEVQRFGEPPGNGAGKDGE